MGKTCPFFRIADMYVGETTCDGKKKAYEILGEDVPMHIRTFPDEAGKRTILKWKDEIAEFAMVVQEFTGNEITAEKLAEAIKIVNEKRKAMQRVYVPASRNACRYPAGYALLMIQIAFFDDPNAAPRCATGWPTSSNSGSRTASASYPREPSGYSSPVHRSRYPTGSCTTH